MRGSVTRHGRLAARWSPGAAASRRASRGLGAVLLTLCALALLGSRQLYNAILTNEQASDAADLYQDARYYAAVEGLELATYRLDLSAAARRRHDEASAALDGTLTQIEQSPEGRAAPRTVALLIDDYDRYTTFARRNYSGGWLWWCPGVSEYGGVDGLEGVDAVFLGGGDVAADAGPGCGAGVGAVGAGDLDVGFGGA